jgi:hypothetical protein
MAESLAEKRAAVCSFPARRLFSLVCDIIRSSPDKSCFASERTLARSLKCRASLVHSAKLELIEAGALCLSLRQNGNRRNPRYRLSLPPKTKKRRSPFFNSRASNQDTKQQYDAVSRTPNHSRTPESKIFYSAARVFYMVWTFGQL